MTNSTANSATSVLARWLKFNLVGGIGIGVQLAVLAVLRSGFSMNYLLATAIAVEVTVIHNFVWHERYTWAERASHFWLRRLAKFHLSNGAISLLGNLAIMKLLVGILDLNYFAANLAGISVCSLVNFAVSDQFVFANESGG